MTTAAGARNLLTDNPALYEARFPDPDHSAARFVDDILATYLTSDDAAPRTHPATVLDLGCGTGRDLGYLARRGYRCLGIDQSPAMVRYAQQQYPGVRAAVGDLRTFEVDASVDAIVCLDSALLYCHTDAELESCLRCCRRHLRPGGLLIAEMRNGAFFLGNPELLDGPTHSAFSWHGHTWRAETTLWIDHAAQLLRRRRQWQIPECTEPLVQTSAWRLLFPLELTGHLQRAGFVVRALFDTPGPRTETGWPGRGTDLGGTALCGDRLHVIAEAV
ncbi:MULTISPECIES: trans-aconitate 2-methyltransferase [Rhodococcus]|jgi:SAM-dependent methyltransferase|uniref:class I SAM-dependent methyltransferase n=1 Tax=Rhodococcus TaxID=1827 RepID=UPI0002D22CF8|nr:MULTISPECIES: class I SAM-dependent methyltransferase [Rhodococcus]AKE91492.1 SAM-dependent methyltransferase [Rhodococcus aetherivorans]ANZ23679.1 SAM-dependent methyltransferase [Rhodococcus sp. WB1]MBC2589312.1 class I SAM-dependent methyltransferase [Rhodococcus aetherivorans]MDV6294229.1 class I SAM-dependent methyltransferase [Rhodococcus aetherivorans]QIX52079.1 class I SAM-dependent methyltransferase [Rhodococcus sp. DMU1]